MVICSTLYLCRQFIVNYFTKDLTLLSFQRHLCSDASWMKKHLRSDIPVPSQNYLFIFSLIHKGLESTTGKKTSWESKGGKVEEI